MYTALFCSTAAPGCRQMVLTTNARKARQHGKVILAGQAWRHDGKHWQCDRCAAGWYEAIRQAEKTA
jgi:hypothetical protein